MMKSTVVQDQYFEFRGFLFRELIQEYLKGAAVASRHFQQQAFTINGRKGAEQVEIFKTVEERSDRFDSFGCNHSSEHGQQTKAAFILKVQINAAAAAFMMFFFNLFKFSGQVF